MFAGVLDKNAAAISESNSDFPVPGGPETSTFFDDLSFFRMLSVMGLSGMVTIPCVIGEIDIALGRVAPAALVQTINYSCCDLLIPRLICSQ